jgi:hypothetical protein
VVHAQGHLPSRQRLLIQKGVSEKYCTNEYHGFTVGTGSNALLPVLYPRPLYLMQYNRALPLPHSALSRHLHSHSVTLIGGNHDIIGVKILNLDISNYTDALNNHGVRGRSEQSR